jgi:hypothetical protein
MRMPCGQDWSSVAGRRLKSANSLRLTASNAENRNVSGAIASPPATEVALRHVPLSPAPSRPCTPARSHRFHAGVVRRRHSQVRRSRDLVLLNPSIECGEFEAIWRPALGGCAEGKPGVEAPFQVIQIRALEVYGAVVDLD